MRALAAIAAAVLVLVPAPAAADEGWEIARLHAQIAVQRDGSLLVREEIDVDFRGLERHGIFREIPVRYAWDERHDRVYRLDVREVTDARGRPWPYEVEENGANARIRIGDPDRTVSGAQSYRIVYHVAGALNAFDAHDELYWNVNGADWPVATRQVTATVVLPPGAQPLRAACFEGPRGSTRPCGSSVSSSSAVFATTRSLGPGEELTVVVAIPKGAVAPPAAIVEEKPRGPDRWFELTPPALGASGLVLVGGLALVARNWWRRGRDRRYIARSAAPGGAEQAAPLLDAPTVVPEYEPPDRLRPAEVGLLLDERADALDLTATLVDLAVRGHLRIEEAPKEGLLGKRDWRLVRLAGGDELADYERTLLDGILAQGTDAVLLSEAKGTVSGALKKAQRQLYDGAMRRTWFTADPEHARLVWAGVGVAVLILGALLTVLLGLAAGLGLVGVATAAVGAVLLATHQAMARRTARGSELLRRILGFRTYMHTAERHRADFAEREGIFASFLPYAVVFGIVDRWARAFEGLDRQAAAAVTGWYAGHGAFDVMAFSNDLASFSSNVSSTIAYTPGTSGSSGFSGGGFSGGGGGGGGGGSW